MGCSHHGASCDLLCCWVVYLLQNSSTEQRFQLVMLRLGRRDVDSQDTGAAVPQSGILWKLR